MTGSNSGIGKLLAVVAEDRVEADLQALCSHALGRKAAVISEVRSEPAGMIFLRTDIGGIRVLDMLVGDPLSRTC